MNVRGKRYRKSTFVKVACAGSQTFGTKVRFRINNRIGIDNEKFIKSYYHALVTFLLSLYLELNFKLSF